MQGDQYMYFQLHGNTEYMVIERPPINPCHLDSCREILVGGWDCETLTQAPALVRGW